MATSSGPLPSSSGGTELERIRSSVATYFPVYETRVGPQSLILAVHIDMATLEDRFDRLRQALWTQGYIPLLRRDSGEEFIEVIRRPRTGRSRIWINLLLLANQLLNGAGIEVVETPGEICTPLGDSSLACPRSILPNMVLVIEDFCDELVEFGRHDVALDIHVNLLPLVQNDEEEKTRIEGKIYLDCLLLNQSLPVCIETPFCEGWEQTQEELGSEKVYPESTPIEQVNEAFRKRIKVLRYDASNGVYTCWVYPLRSKFIVRLPPDVKVDVPEALKEFRIASGTIRVEAFDEAVRASSGTRGLIDVSPEADIYIEFYRQKFFTLNLV